jgi:hypothetical protein
MALVPEQDGGGRGGDLLDMDVGAGAGRGTAAHDLAILDHLMQRFDGMDQGLGRGRTTRRVHIVGHDLIDALHDRIVVEHATRAGADTHRDDPLGLHHLVVHLAQHRSHLLADAAGDDHDVGLAWRRTENLHAEPRDVVVGTTGGHHLDRAARQSERSRPRRT